MTAEPGFLEERDVERLGDALFYLASRVWAAEERMRLLEALLVERGVVDAGAVDRSETADALGEELADRRRRFVDTLLETLVRGGERGV